MKKVLLGSTALLLSAGVAAADVAVSGDGRMGIVQDAETISSDPDLGFTSRIRIAFSASGETDAGMAFGGSIRADNAAGGASGTAGSVFVEGTFGKFSMGDVSGAAEAAVGDVSGLGLTGLDDFNENIYLNNNTDVDSTDDDVDATAAVRPVLRWDYSFGAGTVYASYSNPSAVGATGGIFDGQEIEAYSVGADYTFNNITLAAGYETLDAEVDGTFDHWMLGATAVFGDATIKATYGDSSDLDLTQWALSIDYVFGATTVTAYYRDLEVTLPGVGGPALIETDGFGIGASYDLGGGASIVGGYADIDDGIASTSDSRYDLGLNFSF